MLLSKINEQEFKAIAKNLNKEITKLNSKITLSHSASLNLLARSLGYSDYNTYKGVNKQDSEIINDFQKEHDKLAFKLTHEIKLNKIDVDSSIKWIFNHPYFSKNQLLTYINTITDELSYGIKSFDDFVLFSFDIFMERYVYHRFEEYMNSCVIFRDSSVVQSYDDMPSLNGIKQAMDSIKEWDLFANEIVSFAPSYINKKYFIEERLEIETTDAFKRILHSALLLLKFEDTNLMTNNEFVSLNLKIINEAIEEKDNSYKLDATHIPNALHLANIFSSNYTISGNHFFNKPENSELLLSSYFINLLVKNFTYKSGRYDTQLIKSMSKGSDGIEIQLDESMTKVLSKESNLTLKELLKQN
ncbi:hypothetical protein KJ870_10350 [bacterium]|nr:hypothetical protein [bacterium]MBU1435327.1 hypothetical protein [bacterium]MBU1503525.1 hypothetical protein [bacterium]